MIGSEVYAVNFYIQLMLKKKKQDRFFMRQQ